MDIPIIIYALDPQFISISQSYFEKLESRVLFVRSTLEVGGLGGAKERVGEVVVEDSLFELVATPFQHVLEVANVARFECTGTTFANNSIFAGDDGTALRHH